MIVQTSIQWRQSGANTGKQWKTFFIVVDTRCQMPDELRDATAGSTITKNSSTVSKNVRDQDQDIERSKLVWKKKVCSKHETQVLLKVEFLF